MIRIKLLMQPDIDLILKWNKHTSADFLFQWAGKGYSFPLTTEQIQPKIISPVHIPDAAAMVFKIIKGLPGEMIGTVELSKIERDKEQAWVSRFLIGEKTNRNRGYGSKALHKVMTFANYRLGIKNLYLRVFRFNKGAIQCYEKMGFEIIKDIPNSRDSTWDAFVMKRIV
jgi:RimJ/RimL family protein N-acetyltransferase